MLKSTFKCVHVSDGEHGGQTALLLAGPPVDGPADAPRLALTVENASGEFEDGAEYSVSFEAVTAGRGELSA